MKAPAKLTKRQEAAWQAFWTAYPRREGKAAARELFAALTSDAGPAGGEDGQFLARAAGRFAAQCRERKIETMFIPYAKTWLRQRGFEDDAFRDPPAGEAQSAAPADGPNELWWPDFQAVGMDRATFDRWIAPCVIDAGSDGAATAFKAPTPFHAQWLETRLDHLIRRACGRMPDIEVM